MSLIKSSLAALAITFSTATVVAPIATAQGTTVIVIDQNTILRDSKGGKDIQAKLTGIAQRMEAELKPTSDALNTEGKQIEARAKAMTPQQRQADAALKSQLDNYARKVREFERKRQITAQELVLTERKAYADLYEKLRPVLQEVVTERGAQIMLDRSQVTYRDPATDVTALVIQKLDARAPTIAVTRQRVPTTPPK